MRQIFIEESTLSSLEGSKLDAVYEIYQWAAVIIECDGGYMAFESVADADTWSAQT